MKYIISLIALCLVSGCAGMKPVSAHVDLGMLGGIVNVGIGGSIGDGKFDPVIEVNGDQKRPLRQRSYLDELMAKGEPIETHGAFTFKESRKLTDAGWIERDGWWFPPE
jgi:hypothetical protein